MDPMLEHALDFDTDENEEREWFGWYDDIVLTKPHLVLLYVMCLCNAVKICCSAYDSCAKYKVGSGLIDVILDQPSHGYVSHSN